MTIIIEAINLANRMNILSSFFIRNVGGYMSPIVARAPV